MSTTPTNPTPSVLIVGAGPTGLMLACQLTRFGIPYRIIEQHSGPTTQSRALAIQPRSLELFAQMGLAEQAVAQGRPAKGIYYVARGKLVQRLALEGYGTGLTAFPYLLILDQAQTEQLLIDFLHRHGHAVEWQTELVSFTQSSRGVVATLQPAAGPPEQVQAAWLVGADGASSTVRHGLGIPFAGKTYQASLFVLDCRLAWPFPDDEGYIAFSATSFAAFFPMTAGRWRVISILPDAVSTQESITFAEVAQGFAARMQMEVVLSDPHWLSVYHSHHRSAATFQQGRCFLAGDAAHVHSPVGAQGMNTGLQDAHNLAWKLALVITGHAAPWLLATYTEERRPVAQRLVRTTDRVFQLTLSQNPLLRWWIMYLAPKALALVLREKHLARLAFTTIAQIGITYRQNRLARHASGGAFPRQAPRPGDRLPYVEFAAGGNKVNIQDAVKEPAFHLLLFPGTQPAARLLTLQQVADTFAGVIVVKTIPLAPGTQALYQRFRMGQGGCYLVRPDMYIAYRSVGFNAMHLAHYLARFLLQSGRTAPHASLRDEERQRP
jgi:2-polyprenyl-6-methoxyphenol hydroxylase-like FAD-dependent oxidoreductase